MIRKREPLRYYFAGVGIGLHGRYLSAILVAASLMMMVAVPTTITFVSFGIFALGGVYGLLRPSHPGYFVEVRDKCLLVNAPWGREFSYQDIASANFYYYQKGDIIRAVLNFSISFNRFFGGQQRPYGKPGQVDEEVIHLKFARWLLIYFPLPPFLIPVRSVMLRVDDAGSLRREINRRLPSVNGE